MTTLTLPEVYQKLIDNLFITPKSLKTTLQDIYPDTIQISKLIVENVDHDCLYRELDADFNFDLIAKDYERFLEKENKKNKTSKRKSNANADAVDDAVADAVDDKEKIEICDTPALRTRFIKERARTKMRLSLRETSKIEKAKLRKRIYMDNKVKDSSDNDASKDNESLTFPELDILYKEQGGVTTELYLLITPCGHYTFYAPSLIHAGVLSYMLSPNFCVKELSTSEYSPICSEWEEWFEENDIDQTWLTNVRNLNYLLDAVRSLVAGNENVRWVYEKKLTKLLKNDRMVNGVFILHEFFCQFHREYTSKRSLLNTRIIEVYQDLVSCLSKDKITKDYHKKPFYCMSCYLAGE